MPIRWYEYGIGNIIKCQTIHIQLIKHNQTENVFLRERVFIGEHPNRIQNSIEHCSVNASNSKEYFEYVLIMQSEYVLSRMHKNVENVVLRVVSPLH